MKGKFTAFMQKNKPDPQASEVTCLEARGTNDDW
jgi:hypothetical protein